jgi:hypothetical protein
MRARSHQGKRTYHNVAHSSLKSHMCSNSIIGSGLLELNSHFGFPVSIDHTIQPAPTAGPFVSKLCT